METAMALDPLDDLVKEHALFLRFLDQAMLRAEAGARVWEGAEFPQFLRMLGQVHHAKEEEALFPLVLGSEAIQVGGPKCMTFFSPRVLGSGWPDAFLKLAKMFGEPAPDSAASSFRRRIFEENSMLKIPVGDHMMGVMAADRLLAGGDLDLFRNFVELLREHIRREDECLFPLLRSKLSKEQGRAYIVAARKIEERAGARELTHSLMAASRTG